MLATVGSSSTCALSSIRSLRFAGWAKTTSWPRDAWRAGHDGQRTALHGGGALADQRDGHRVEAHAVARDAAGGVGVIEEGVIVVVAPLIFPLGLLGGYSMLVWCICRESGVRRLRAARHPTLCITPCAGQRALAAYGLSLISTPAGVAVAAGAEALANVGSTASTALGTRSVAIRLHEFPGPVERNQEPRWTQ